MVEDRIIVNDLELTDAGLAGFVSGIAEPERPGLAANALRVGLQALATAGNSANVDFVRAEFGRMVEQMAATQTRAAEALDATLRATFADGEGRLPRTLEDFLGDSGKLQRLTGALFDPNRRDSAIGQFNEMLGKYFDGDGSRLAQLLDPTREASPLHQFRNEVTGEFRSLGERIASLEAANRARADERARGTAKGLEFEDVVEAGLAELARGVGDFLERTGTDAGDALRSKKGDFVLTIDPSRTNGRELRVVIEAKDRSLSRRVMAEELTAARANRGAAIAHGGLHSRTCADRRVPIRPGRLGRVRGLRSGGGWGPWPRSRLPGRPRHGPPHPARHRRPGGRRRHSARRSRTSSSPSTTCGR